MNPAEEHPYITAVEIPGDIAADRMKTAEHGMREWFTRAAAIGYKPVIDENGSISMAMNFYWDSGRAWLRISGPVKDPVEFPRTS